MIIEIIAWIIRHIGKDDRPLPPSFRRRNPIFVLPLQRNGRHPVTIEPGLTVHLYLVSLHGDYSAISTGYTAICCVVVSQHSTAAMPPSSALQADSLSGTEVTEPHHVRPLIPISFQT